MFKKFFDLRENIIIIFKDYSIFLSKTQHKAKYGRGLKILTPKTNASKITNSTCTSKSR